jgi:hypothetical protein
MKIAPKRTLTAVTVCCLILLPQIIFAQEMGNVLINTNPQGALVKLNGELIMSGVTPVRFDRRLSGQYKIEIFRDGYEKYKSTAYFSEVQSSQLDISLVPKTRTKALVRSLVIPGWGQRYYGNNLKSAFYFLGTAGGVVAYFIVRHDYNNKYDDYIIRKEAYENETLWSELPRLEAELMEEQERAHNAEKWMNFTIGVAVGFYALNVLDNILFFPDFDSYTEYKAITAAPDIDADKVGVRLALKF